MMSVIGNNLLSINFPSYQYSKDDIEIYRQKCITFLIKNGMIVTDIQFRNVGSTHGFLISIDGDLDHLRNIRNLKGHAIQSDK